MPANPKHLTASPWQRFAKISAALLGGYIVSSAFHMALMSWLDPITILITSAFSAFVLWVVLMIVAFLARNGWKVWGLYLLIATIFSAITWLGKIYNPDLVANG